MYVVKKLKVVERIFPVVLGDIREVDRVRVRVELRCV